MKTTSTWKRKYILDYLATAFGDLVAGPLQIFRVKDNKDGTIFCGRIVIRATKAAVDLAVVEGTILGTIIGECPAERFS